MSNWSRKDLKPPPSGGPGIETRFNGAPPLRQSSHWKVGSSPKEAAQAALGKGGQSMLPENTPK